MVIVRKKFKILIAYNMIAFYKVKILKNHLKLWDIHTVKTEIKSPNCESNIVVCKCQVNKIEI